MLKNKEKLFPNTKQLCSSAEPILFKHMESSSNTNSTINTDSSKLNTNWNSLDKQLSIITNYSKEKK